jgi:2-polyprenyl-3-methyl-5-hydroxy-6-metoxy-1,4-benzoquinol methylase
MIKLTHCVACHSENIKFLNTIKDHSVTGETFELYECGNCTFRFTQNQPDEAGCGLYYQSDQYVSHSDLNQGFIYKAYHLVRHIMLSRKLSLIKKFKASKKLLDFGSGTGYFVNHAINNGYEAEGIEVDDHARQYSKEKFGINSYHPNHLKVENYPNKFGYITLWHVLEHLYQPDDYLTTFNNLLSEDGYLIVALPNHLSLDAKIYKTFWAAYDVPRHLWHFNPNALKIMAERNGFRIIEKKMMPFDPFYNALLSEKYRKYSFGYIRGLFVGFAALVNGMINVDAASSVIYVMQKTK